METAMLYSHTHRARSFLVVALLVISATEPGALAQPGGGDDTGGGTVYFFNGGPTNWLWSMNSDGSNTTQLGWWGYLNSPSRELHGEHRWYVTVQSIPDSYYPDGITLRTEVFAYREDYDPDNSDTYVQLTDDATLQALFTGFKGIQWSPGDQTISFEARRWEGSTPVEGGLYTADLVYSADGNIIGLAAAPTDPTIPFPLDGDGMPTLGRHAWDDTGTRVVYNDDGWTGLWVADLSSGTQTQILSGVARDPDWSPDGTKIAFSRAQRIYTIKSNGKSLKEVISPTVAGTAYWDAFGIPYFSPAGTHIVCVGLSEENGELNNEVFRATVNGHALTNLTGTPSVNEIPVGWRGGSPAPPPPPPPGDVIVADIFPDTMFVGTAIDVTITGSDFQPGAEVILVNGAGPTPVADVTNVWPDGLTIEATITVANGGPPGVRVWDVRVTNPDGSAGTLTAGFMVIK
jgi:hypothetical protein